METKYLVSPNLGNRLRLAVSIVALLALAIGVSATASAADWKADWDSAVKGAQKESHLGIMHGGGASATMQNIFREDFPKQFPGIQVELLVGGGRSIAPRMLAERKSGKFSWDVYIGGTTTALGSLKPAGAFDPIRSAFILPQVSDPKNWFGGKMDFADERDVYILAFGGYVIPPFAFNTQMVKTSDVHSYWDLLEPRWKGKIVMLDPRTPGAGLAFATFCYFQSSLGKEYLKRLLVDQKVVLVRDYRPVLEEIARGNYLLGIGIHQGIFDELVSKGLPLGRFTANDLKEGSYLTTATDSIGLINKAPHPNAAKVFINWFLDKDTQRKYSQASGTWSRRTDVVPDYLDPAIVPKIDKYDSYQANYKENYVKKRGDIVRYLKTLIAR